MDPPSHTKMCEAWERYLQHTHLLYMYKAWGDTIQSIPSVTLLQW